MEGITLTIAFVAGLVSFLSPCVLPIIPGFLSYLAGRSLGGGSPSRREVFTHSVFFVLGFAVVFAALGVLLQTVLEAIAYDVQEWLSRIGGALIILFGLYLTGLIRISFFERGHTFAVREESPFGKGARALLGAKASRYAISFMFGFAFAAGWTPCVGPALGAILGFAATSPGQAFYLLLSYGLGLGLPFLLVGAFASQASRLVERYSGVLKYVHIVFGVILIALGVLVFTQTLNRIANFELLNTLLLQ